MDGKAAAISVLDARSKREMGDPTQKLRATGTTDSARTNVATYTLWLSANARMAENADLSHSDSGGNVISNVETYPPKECTPRNQTHTSLE